VMGAVETRWRLQLFADHRGDCARRALERTTLSQQIRALQLIFVESLPCQRTGLGQGQAEASRCQQRQGGGAS